MTGNYIPIHAETQFCIKTQTHNANIFCPRSWLKNPTHRMLKCTRHDNDDIPHSQTIPPDSPPIAMFHPQTLLLEPLRNQFLLLLTKPVPIT
jgi:hypothetical protein